MTSETVPKQIRPPVVVGVDGSETALKAVEWAAGEARARRVDLRIVHAVDPFDGAGAFPLSSGRAQAGAARLVEEASARASAVAPGLDVTTDIVYSSPVQALLGQRTELVCIGSRGTAPAHPGHAASVATELLVAARCSVTFVRTTVPSAGWVVADVSAVPHVADVLRAAAREAAWRGLPLRLSCTSDALRARVERDVSHCLGAHSGLDVKMVSPLWSLEDFLRHYTRQIALFVAPPRYLHDIGTVLDATAATALELVECPVMICANDGAETGAAIDASERMAVE